MAKQESTKDTLRWKQALMTGHTHTKQLSGEPNQLSWDNIIMLL